MRDEKREGHMSVQSSQQQMVDDNVVISCQKRKERKNSEEITAAVNFMVNDATRKCNNGNSLPEQ